MAAMSNGGHPAGAPGLGSRAMQRRRATRKRTLAALKSAAGINRPCAKQCDMATLESVHECIMELAGQQAETTEWIAIIRILQNLEHLSYNTVAQAIESWQEISVFCLHLDGTKVKLTVPLVHGLDALEESDNCTSSEEMGTDCESTCKRVFDGSWTGNPESMSKLDELLANFKEYDTSHCDVYLCPLPSHETSELQAKSGQFAGEMAVEQMKAMGISQMLIGHHERKAAFGTFPRNHNETLAVKMKFILDAGMSCVYSIGEPQSIRERVLREVLQEMDVQLTPIYDLLDPAHVISAYEPAWAMSFAATANPAEAQATHKGIRDLIEQKAAKTIADGTRIQYGGYVAAKDVPSLLTQPDIDGLLVAGASLQPECAHIVVAIKKAI